MANFLRVMRCMFNQPSFTAPSVPMTGKTVVITGPTIGGIGFETAKALAKFGARIILGARNPSTGAEAAAAIRTAAPSSSVELLQCDVSRLDSIDSFAQGIAPLAPDGVDVLVCNAGAMTSGSQKTAEGVELTFAVCALGHHKLIHLVKPKRLVWVSGDIYVMSQGLPDPFCNDTGDRAYFKACLARMLLSRAWKKHSAMEGRPMEVVVLHPGVINSDLAKLSGIVKRLAGTVLITTEQGAQASILAASAAHEDLHQERALPYYHNKDKWLDLQDGDVAMNEEAADKLFENCNEICNIQSS